MASKSGASQDKPEKTDETDDKSAADVKGDADKKSGDDKSDASEKVKEAGLAEGVKETLDVSGEDTPKDKTEGGDKDKTDADKSGEIPALGKEGDSEDKSGSGNDGRESSHSSSYESSSYSYGSGDIFSGGGQSSLGGFFSGNSSERFGSNASGDFGRSGLDASGLGSLDNDTTRGASADKSVYGDHGFHGDDNRTGVDTSTVLYEDDEPEVPENRAPSAANDSITAVEGHYYEGNLLSNNGHGADTDADGDTLGTEYGTFVTTAGNEIEIGSDGAFVFRPTSHFTGADSYVYTLIDTNGATDTATVTFNVINNQAPVGHTDDFTLFSGETIGGYVLDDNGHGVDTDAEGDVFLAVEHTNFLSAHGGTVSLYIDGSFNYTPAVGFVGSDTFQYEVSDGIDTGTGTVNLTVNRVETLGTGAADALYGNSNADAIYGLGGDDILSGYGAVDTLTGGTGADTFLFTEDSFGSGADIITDFSAGDGDKIDISLLLGDYDSLHDLITDFIHLTTSGGSTTVSVDTAGGGSFTDVAQLQGVTVASSIADLIDDGTLIIA